MTGGRVERGPELVDLGFDAGRSGFVEKKVKVKVCPLERTEQ